MEVVGGVVEGHLLGSYRGEEVSEGSKCTLSEEVVRRDSPRKGVSGGLRKCRRGSQKFPPMKNVLI